MRPSVLPTVLVASLLMGCSYISFPPQVRGNKVDVDTLKELTPGTSSRADVVSLLGSPTSKAVFDDNTWYYISEVTQPQVGRIQSVNSQEVVAMTFDSGGTLRSLKRLDQKDSKPVSVVSRATPSPGSEASFMQQLLGNIGRYSPTTGASSGSGGSGASFGSK